jgi:hypothetical protein
MSCAGTYGEKVHDTRIRIAQTWDPKKTNPRVVRAGDDRSGEVTAASTGCLYLALAFTLQVGIR